MVYKKALVLSLGFCGSVFAQDIEVNGTVEVVLPPKAMQANLTPKAPVQKIKLLKIELSENARKIIMDRKAKPYLAEAFRATKYLPEQVQLGMNGVPVLSQGFHGSCVTFAVTAAMDAALQLGDYISQTCSLQLGNYLEQNGYLPSGWDGSQGMMVLQQFQSFGMVSKSKEASLGCGGLTQYPTYDQVAPKSFMTVDEYHSMSENVGKLIKATPILDPVNAIVEKTDTNKVIQDIKKALSENERVTVGVLLWDIDEGISGAVGKHQIINDTWVLTPEIARDIVFSPNYGGHEMVITGYDDNAVAIDGHGNQYKGLLTMRNSWGKGLGNQGDFYMSYDYFKVLALEAYRIRVAEDSTE